MRDTTLLARWLDFYGLGFFHLQVSENRIHVGLCNGGNLAHVTGKYKHRAGFSAHDLDIYMTSPGLGPSKLRPLAQLCAPQCASFILFRLLSHLHGYKMVPVFFRLSLSKVSSNGRAGTFPQHSHPKSYCLTEILICPGTYA